MINRKILPAVKLLYNNDTILIFHGHQTDRYLQRHNIFSLLGVRWCSRLFGIKNGTISMDSKKKFRNESLSYDFSFSKKIISVLGHTHRPLFESLSKMDELRMKIENLIGKYPHSGEKDKIRIASALKKYKSEFDILYERNRKKDSRNGIYDEKVLAPCLFNSGSVIGKHGLTGIEINKGIISLVYWFDRYRSQRYLKQKGSGLKRLGKSDFFKAVLKEQSLDYIFTKIKLLA